MINYNSEQLSAIKHDPAPLLILAGAGTGKTTTIVARIAELISKKNIKPQEILVLTYTVKAAENFKERLSNIVGSEIDSLQSYNYHAFAKLVSMEFYRELGYSYEPELITDSDIYFLIRKHIDTVNLLSVIFKRDPIEAIKYMKKANESFLIFSSFNTLKTSFIGFFNIFFDLFNSSFVLVSVK